MFTYRHTVTTNASRRQESSMSYAYVAQHGAVVRRWQRAIAVVKDGQRLAFWPLLHLQS